MDGQTDRRTDRKIISIQNRSRLRTYEACGGDGGGGGSLRCWLFRGGGGGVGAPSDVGGLSVDGVS